ncbi:hypothetical protein [Paraclostridium sordellii]|uniref:hypothetical protein n=1 Tax=Paraclostridium sordellii TaxID=1505 RepID=UPI000C7751E4|nr:hypothetical protein [Paeniclostridium sordellii]AUN13771.1 hypothetical protein RSJ16_05845 [Paeniclostridium sordellii]MDU5021028.1 hypothetical protein [Clostridiales bacterium]
MGKNLYKLSILAVCLVIISIPLYFIYTLFFVKVVTKNFVTTGTIIEMEYEEGEWNTKEVTNNVKQKDGTIKKVKEKKKVYDSEEWDLEIRYTDSQGNERIFKEEPINKSDLYLSLEKKHLKVGDKVNLLIEERFMNKKLVGTDILKLNE